MALKVKRIYDPASPEDGVRVLVDRLWPRGLSKEKAQVDWWAKELAPSDELRRFFAHDPEKYPEFLRRYRKELSAPSWLAPRRGPQRGHEQAALALAGGATFACGYLEGNPALERLRALIQEKTVALLFAAREEPYHNARALPEILGQEQEP
ncbi:DUF488 domain-containing protein [Thermus tengchongensis]|uniref:DUF488 domain-containing protein n=1 Tax=Thermus tengchongensis TaxID=1214928 RepID=UPI001F44DAC6|nr:DUF488 family protein [Thermus tengchongensis]